jgi:hypothetical protein
MGTLLSEELVRAHQADRRAAAERWSLARDARARRPRGQATRAPSRARAGLARALHAVARRLEAGSSAVL